MQDGPGVLQQSKSLAVEFTTLQALRLQSCNSTSRARCMPGVSTAAQLPRHCSQGTHSAHSAAGAGQGAGSRDHKGLEEAAVRRTKIRQQRGSNRKTQNSIKHLPEGNRGIPRQTGAAIAAHKAGQAAGIW